MRGCSLRGGGGYGLGFSYSGEDLRCGWSMETLCVAALSSLRKHFPKPYTDFQGLVKCSQ